MMPLNRANFQQLSTIFFRIVTPIANGFWLPMNKSIEQDFQNTDYSVVAEKMLTV